MNLMRSGRTSLEKILLILFWFSAALYVLDVLLGKLGGMLPDSLLQLLPDNALQFVLLVLISVFLVAAALVAERRENTPSKRD
ncbi:MAG: hypothetical protein WBL23_10650 [Salinisphaera sp.]|uniref:hypothetical protein n=1 Tax=Salinisphaera sp. TaxID=1914330 RepID=UPI003C7B9376